MPTISFPCACCGGGGGGGACLCPPPTGDFMYFGYAQYQIILPSPLCGVIPPGTYTLSYDPSLGEGCAWVVKPVEFGAPFLQFLFIQNPPCVSPYGSGWYIQAGVFGVAIYATWGLSTTSPSIDDAGPYVFTLCNNLGCPDPPTTITMTGVNGPPALCCQTCFPPVDTLFITGYIALLGAESPGEGCSCMGGGFGFSGPMTYDTTTFSWNSAPIPTGCGNSFQFKMVCIQTPGGFFGDSLPQLTCTFLGCNEHGSTGFTVSTNQFTTGDPCSEPGPGVINFAAQFFRPSSGFFSGCCPPIFVTQQWGFFAAITE
jgi:hypothetical protein